MKLIRVMARGRKNCRCEADDGCSYLVPVKVVDELTGIKFRTWKRMNSKGKETVESNSDEINAALCGKEWTPSLRDWSKFDSDKELKLIKRGLDGWLRIKRYRLPQGWTMQDLVQECFVHFWEVDAWAKWDQSKGSYFKYVTNVAANWLESFIKSKQVKNTIYFLSLDNKVNVRNKDSDTDETYKARLRDGINYESVNMYNIMKAQMIEGFQNMEDNGYGNYHTVYQGLTEGKTVVEIAKEQQVSLNSVRLRKQELQHEVVRLLSY